MAGGGTGANPTIFEGQAVQTARSSPWPLRVPRNGWLLSALLILMYVSWPWRSAVFYSRDIDDEGFGADVDARIADVSWEIALMIWFSPVIVTLVLLAFMYHPRDKALWDFNRARPIWSTVFSAFVLLLIWHEGLTLAYCALRPWHWLTTVGSVTMLYLLLCLRVSGQYVFTPRPRTRTTVWKDSWIRIEVE